MSTKTIVILGACSGIGREYAQHFSSLGHHVIATAINDETATLLSDDFPDLCVVTLDLCVPESVQGAVQRIHENCSHIDALICNAGIPLGGPVSHLDLQELRRVFQINFFGHLEMMQALLSLLLESQDPRFIWTGSAAGFFVRPLLGGYAASKYAVTAVMDALRVEWYQRIRVSHIMPGGIRTDIWTKGVRAAQSLETREDMKEYRSALVKLKDEALHNATSAAPVKSVVNAVHHAVYSSYPKPIYRVGFDAHLAHWLKWLLPKRVLDWLLRKLFW